MSRALHRVVGPPGSGKTHFLTRQAELAVAKYGVADVAIASLTKAAAKEIAGRTSLAPHQVGTLHAHAYRGLGAPDLAETPEGLRSWNEWVGEANRPWRVTGTAAGDPDDAPAEMANASSEGERLLAELATRRARREDPAAWSVERPDLARFAEAWSTWKRASRRVDFTDLLERALEELDTMPGWPRVILLDEAQDFSRLEFALVRRWAEDCEQLVVCGDPSQNLFSWRGSDPDAFWEGEATTERVLSQSYRCPRAVVEYATAWVARIRGRPPAEYTPRREDPEDPRSPVVEGWVGLGPGERGEEPATFVRPEPLLPWISADLDAGRTAMVLASCGYMLAPTIRLLRDAGVPFHNPYRPAHGGWNPLRGARAALAYLRPSPEAWGDEHRFWTWAEVAAWMEPLDAAGALERGAKSYVKSKCLPDPQAEGEPGDRVADAAAVASLVREGERDACFDLDLEWWGRHLRASQASRYRYALGIARERGPAALREVPRVVVGTVHSVKGSTSDAVYVYPDLSRSANLAGWRDEGPTHDAVVRMFYVAFTRARERLTLLAPATGDYAPLPAPGGTEYLPPPRLRGARLAEKLKADLRKRE